MAKNKPTKRHVAAIMRPGTAMDGRGNRTGADDDEIAVGVPCAILERRGNEDEFGHQVAGTKQIEVSFFVDPAWGLKSRDYLIVNGCRRLEILEVRDPTNIAREVLCLCGEITD